MSIIQRTDTEVLSAWLNHLVVKRGRMPNTARAYSAILYAFVEYLEGRSLFEATVADMENFAHRPRPGYPVVQAGTAATTCYILRSFYRYAHEQELTERNLALALHGPTVRNVQPRSIPDDEWLTIWNSPYTQINQRLVVALGLGFFCGLRRAEIVALRGDQITETQILNFTRKGGGEDVLPWATMLDAHAEGLPHLLGATEKQFRHDLLSLADVAGSETLMGWKNPGSFGSILTSTAARASETVRFTPHQLRHSCATNLLRCGVPLYLVSSLLNHRSIQTTMRYVRAGHDALAEWMDGQHGRGNQSSRDDAPRSDGRHVL